MQQPQDRPKQSSKGPSPAVSANVSEAAPSQTSSLAWATDDISRDRLQRSKTERINNRSENPGRVPSSETAAAQEKDHQGPSLPDRLASSALGATVELLKMAGGVTLSTTGALVAPPLHVTRQFLLPALWDASLASLHDNTPTRVKDWFRIVSSSISHFITVLGSTQRGKHLRGRLLVVWRDILECLTADVTRQVFLDGTACMVKGAQMLNTPQCHAYIQQVCIWSCRLLQALSHGRNQQLLHNVAAACVSATKIVSDPQTTLALAEVTAYLCYALEMEQEFHQSDRKPQGKRERHEYEQATNVDRKTFVRNPEATVEQVILSSMGMTVTETTAEGQSEVTSVPGSSVPSRIVCKDAIHPQTDEKSKGSVSDGSEKDSNASSVDWDQQSSIRQQVEETASNESKHQPTETWADRARKDIDIMYLKEQIHAATTAAQSVDPVIVEDVDSIEEFVMEKPDEATDMNKRPRTSIEQENEDSPLPAMDWSSIPNAMPMEGETSIHHFYRVLNDILEQKRGEALQAQYQNDNGEEGNLRSGRCRVTKRSGLERFVTDTLRKRLEGNVSRADTKANIQSSLSDQNNHRYLLLIGLVLIAVAFFWILLGFYGLYKLFVPTIISAPSPQTQEIVIRIVRDMVEGDGMMDISESTNHQIAQCVADNLA